MATPVLINGTSGLLATPIEVGGPGTKLLDIVAYNASAAAAFVHFYDSQIAPTVGTTVPKFTVGLNTLVTSTIAVQDGYGGLFFQNGLWAAATTTLSGSSAPASALAVSVGIS